MTTSVKSPCAGVWRDPIHFLALGFGSGCAPKAPGTFGTLAAIPLYWLAQDLSLGIFVVLTALMFVLGIWLCERTAKDLGVHDHPAIVWDEIVGYFATMIAAPKGWLWIVLGFVSVSSIRYPQALAYQKRWIGQVGGGFGIMFDDLLAAVYAWLLLQGLAQLV